MTAWNTCNFQKRIPPLGGLNVPRVNQGFVLDWLCCVLVTTKQPSAQSLRVAETCCLGVRLFDQAFHSFRIPTEASQLKSSP
mmetsp:Transcript_42838/g.80368  ORF Transcript_42838/g.80368 Transcript_42838/m.80368 type:complete len:82 (-) Transcript_42838:638-883(-)